MKKRLKGDKTEAGRQIRGWASGNSDGKVSADSRCNSGEQ